MGASWQSENVESELGKVLTYGKSNNPTKGQKQEHKGRGGEEARKQKGHRRGRWLEAHARACDSVIRAPAVGAFREVRCKAEESGRVGNVKAGRHCCASEAVTSSFSCLAHKSEK